MKELLNTIIERPYVFLFLGAYLILSIRLWGWKKSLIWLVSGYFIAWLSEYSSIHNGFPYGQYYYVYENLKGELLVAGVPFFDSLSYPFLIFAAYSIAVYVTRDTLPVTRKIVFGALLTMLLDVIIDPIATMGDKWFLGKIHYYAHPGWYFGIPMTNFAGWFLVAAVVIAFNILIWRGIEAGNKRQETGSNKQQARNTKQETGSRKQESCYHASCIMPPASYFTRQISGPFFYASIALFNIIITFWVGEWKLGIASTVILSIIIAFIYKRHKNIKETK